MGEPGNPHFYDFGILGRVHGSQNQLIFGDTWTPKKKQENSLELFKISYFYKSRNIENPMRMQRWESVWKGGIQNLTKKGHLLVDRAIN